MVYVLAFLCILFLGLVIAWRLMIWMPGASYRGTPSPLNEQEEKTREGLMRDLTILGHDIGERNILKDLAPPCLPVTHRCMTRPPSMHRSSLKAAGRLSALIDRARIKHLARTVCARAEPDCLGIHP